MIDFGLGNGRLTLVGAVLAAVMLAVPLGRACSRQLKRLVAFCRGIPLFCRIAFAAVFATLGLYSSIKTNDLTSASFPMPPDIPGYVRPLSLAQTNILSLVETPPLREGPVFSPMQNPPSLLAAGRVPLPAASHAERIARHWHLHGAWDDSFWFAFGGGFVFPEGTNHLAGVEVLARGELWRTPFDASPVASLGAAVSIVSNVTEFSCFMTPSNSCRFSWHDAFVGRVTAEEIANGVAVPIDAAMELFRNGDVLVETNGVSTLIPRALPFPNDGFGQDGEWVAANFTNAAEIAAAGGYAAWVDAQVGTDLTNGLYKLTVSLADDPPETTFLSVGDLSVAVTNAGEYVFLLGKGVAYDFTVFPPNGGVTLSAVDDMAASPSPPPLRSPAAPGRGEWVPDWGGFWTDYAPFAGAARLWWLPTLCGSPDVFHLAPGDSTTVFSATLSDCAQTNGVSFHWNVDGNFTAATPGERTTEVTVETFPRWGSASLSVTADFGFGILLCSYMDFCFGTNSFPMATTHVSLPGALVVRDKWMAGSVSASGRAWLASDELTNGTVRVWLERGGERVSIPGFPVERTVAWSSSVTVDFPIDGVAASLAAGDVEVRCSFEPEEGEAQTNAAQTTVVSPLAVRVPSAPTTGLAVLRGADVGVVLDVQPAGVQGLNVEWFTAKRRTRDDYDPWALAASGSTGATLSMSASGVFALCARLVCGCQSNETFYVHFTDEPKSSELNGQIGPCKVGQWDHIGVASTAGLLRLRNTALGYMEHREYGYFSYLPSRYGFSAIKENKWKCNRFVADIAIEAGFQVPHNQTMPLFGKTYPPMANDWVYGNNISGWTHLGLTYPEPGFIAGRPSPGDAGHCGIVDYDGWVISGRHIGVERNAKKMLDGTTRYSKPEED